MLTSHEIDILQASLSLANPTTSEEMQAHNIIREKLEWMRPNNEKEGIENGGSAPAESPGQSQTV
jgi:hypothetical protein